MDKNLLDLYSDYLLSSFGPTTATGLSALLEGQVSHDQVTRFLSQETYTSKTLWQQVKPMLRSVERDEGVLIFDDTIQAKPHTDENELICWHFDHSQNRSVKGINLLNCVYDLTIPVAFELVRKPLVFSDPETGQAKQKSEVTKNELLRSRLHTCQHNQIKYRYVLADSWFSAKENLTFIRHRLDKHFIVALKANRTVALSKEAKLQGRFTRIDALSWSEEEPQLGWIKGLDFPVLLHRQVFTNKDDSTGTLYLACSDLNRQALCIDTIYQTVESRMLPQNPQVRCRFGQIAHQARPYPEQSCLHGLVCCFSNRVSARPSPHEALCLESSTLYESHSNRFRRTTKTQDCVTSVSKYTNKKVPGVKIINVASKPENNLFT